MILTLMSQTQIYLQWSIMFERNNNSMPLNITQLSTSVVMVTLVKKEKKIVHIVPLSNKAKMLSMNNVFFFLQFKKNMS